MERSRLSRARSFLTLLFVLGFTALAVPETSAGTSLSRDTVRAFLRDHLPERRGTVVTERDGTYYVRFDGPKTPGEVKVYRNSTRSTDQGRKLVERTLGTGTVHVHEDGQGTLQLENTDTATLRPGDRFRPVSHTLSVFNQSGVPDETLRQWLKNHPVIDAVRFLDEAPGPDRFTLSLSDSRLELQPPRQNSARQSISLNERAKPSTPEPTADPSATLRDRADFDQPIHDFEWIRLPTRGSIRLLMLAADEAVGFARYDEGVRSTHWMDVSGRVLDVSFVKASAENPGELFVLAVLQRNDEVQTRAFTFNALDRSVQNHWTEPDAWIRRIGSRQYVLQKIGLNSPLKGEISYVTVSRNGWNRNSSRPNPPKLITPRGYVASDSAFAFLDRSGRLTVRKKGANWAKGVAEYGNVPGTISALRNGRSVTLHPSFPLRTDGSGYRTLLPENIASGMTLFQGLRALRESRVYYLAVKNEDVETLWESNRLAGYVSGTDWHNGRYWIMRVNPDEGTSTFQSFQPGGIKQ